jgi:hypothetical protein
MLRLFEVEKICRARVVRRCAITGNYVAPSWRHTDGMGRCVNLGATISLTLSAFPAQKRTFVLLYFKAEFQAHSSAG